MSRTQDFFSRPDVSEITEEVLINKRLGIFTIKPMSEPQFQGYRERCKLKKAKNETEIDHSKLNMLVITNHVIDPNFNDSELLSQAGCATASEFISRKFIIGDVADIAAKILEASGIDGDINEDIEEAKN